VDDTYCRVKGEWNYLYLVDQEGQTIDFLLTSHRDKAAAAAFLYRAIRGSQSKRRKNVAK